MRPAPLALLVFGLLAPTVAAPQTVDEAPAAAQEDATGPVATKRGGLLSLALGPGAVAHGSLGDLVSSRPRMVQLSILGIPDGRRFVAWLLDFGLVSKDGVTTEGFSAEAASMTFGPTFQIWLTDRLWTSVGVGFAMFEKAVTVPDGAPEGDRSRESSGIGAWGGLGVDVLTTPVFVLDVRVRGQVGPGSGVGAMVGLTVPGR